MGMSVMIFMLSSTFICHSSNPLYQLSSHFPQVEPVIEHHDMVHHMLLYRCPSFVTEPYDKPCYRGDIGDACFRVVAAWGVGGGVREKASTSVDSLYVSVVLVHVDPEFMS